MSSRLPPCLKVIALTLLLLLPFMIYGRTHFYRDPGSIFYDPHRAYKRQYSLQRENEALKFLKTATSPITTMKEAKPDSLICAIIVSFGDKRSEAKHPLAVRPVYFGCVG